MTGIFVLNGPNLNFLGRRDSNTYGKRGIKSLNEILLQESGNLMIEPVIRQTNSESEAIDFIQENYSCAGGIVNLGAWTHYSYALRDALEDFNKPFIEVHISNIMAREEFRRKSVISDIASGIICGFGLFSYVLALKAIADILNIRE